LLTLTSPRLIELQNGDWKLYYVLGNSLFSDRSSDEGLTWSSPADNSIGQLMGEIAVSTLTDQQARIVYTSSASAAPLEIRSARASSAAGTAGFSVESGVRLSTDTGFLSFPLLTRSTETFRWRMYYAYRSSAAAIPQIHSALTITPDVRSVSPSAVLRSVCLERTRILIHVGCHARVHRQTRQIAGDYGPVEVAEHDPWKRTRKSVE
jgi:hypothetical protein